MADEKIKNNTEAKVENQQQEQEKSESKENQQNQQEVRADETDEVPVDSESREDKKDKKEKKSEKDKKEEHIEKLEANLLELSDKHLRLQAEFDNFRRRTLKEKADLIKSGGEKTIVSLLPIIDDFERALNSLKDIPDDDTGKQGTTLIYTKLKDFLKQNNVKEIDALNEDFDVDLHEAVTKIPAPDKKQKGKVIDVIQKGYTLNDRVIRFAKVIVGE